MPPNLKFPLLVDSNFYHEFLNASESERLLISKKIEKVTLSVRVNGGVIGFAYNYNVDYNVDPDTVVLDLYLKVGNENIFMPQLMNLDALFKLLLLSDRQLFFIDLLHQSPADHRFLFFAKSIKFFKRGVEFSTCVLGLLPRLISELLPKDSHRPLISLVLGYLPPEERLDFLDSYSNLSTDIDNFAKLLTLLLPSERLTALTKVLEKLHSNRDAFAREFFYLIEISTIHQILELLPNDQRELFLNDYVDGISEGYETLKDIINDQQTLYQELFLSREPEKRLPCELILNTLPADHHRTRFAIKKLVPIMKKDEELDKVLQWVPENDHQEILSAYHSCRSFNNQQLFKLKNIERISQNTLFLMLDKKMLEDIYDVFAQRSYAALFNDFKTASQAIFDQFKFEPSLPPLDEYDDLKKAYETFETQFGFSLFSKNTSEMSASQQCAINLISICYLYTCLLKLIKNQLSCHQFGQELYDQLINSLIEKLTLIKDSAESLLPIFFYGKWTPLSREFFMRFKMHCELGFSLQVMLEETINVLKEIKPLRNTNDFATLEKIDPQNRFVTTDGYQFDINSLAQWTQANHWTNPFTNSPFSVVDKKNIQEAIIKRLAVVNVLASPVPIEVEEEDLNLLEPAIVIAQTWDISIQDSQGEEETRSISAVDEIDRVSQSISFEEPLLNRSILFQSYRNANANFAIEHGLFSNLPSVVQLQNLAAETGVPVEALQTIAGIYPENYQNQFSKIRMLKSYWLSSSNATPLISCTDVLTMNNVEVENLVVAYRFVRANLLTVGEAKRLTLEERQILSVINTDDSNDVQVKFNQLEAFRQTHALRSEERGVENFSI